MITAFMYFILFTIFLLVMYITLMQLIPKYEDTWFKPFIPIVVGIFTAADWVLDKYFIIVPFVGGWPSSWRDLVTDRVTRYKYLHPKGSLRNKFGTWLCRILDKYDPRGIHCNG